jgi:hypothetical protein
MRPIKLLPLITALAGILCSFPAFSQTQLVSRDFFPADLEFKEIKAPATDRVLTTPADLAKLEQGPVLLEINLKRYSERTYVLTVPGSLSVEILTFGDPREAYSALSFSAKAPLETGPPGDFLAPEPGILFFSAGPYFVKIRSQAGGDLARRVAVSVANRIGRHAPDPPPLVRHIPQDSCHPSSIRYLIGPQAFAIFGTPVAGAQLKVPAEVEIVQARCTDKEQTGVLTLISFPTAQLSDDYYNSGVLYEGAAGKAGTLYTRQTGPIVEILDGNFLPEPADKILSSVKFAYSVKWIFDKNKNQGRTIWGVPVRILGTVVRSLVFTGLLCLASILGGILIAIGRAYIRRRTGREDSDGYIRLKIDEN